MANKISEVLEAASAIAKGMSVTFKEMMSPTVTENYPDEPPKFEERIDMPWLGIDEQFSKRGGAVLNRLAQRLKDFWIGILRGKLPDLLEGIDQR